MQPKTLLGITAEELLALTGQPPAAAEHPIVKHVSQDIIRPTKKHFDKTRTKKARKMAKESRKRNRK